MLLLSSRMPETGGRSVTGRGMAHTLRESRFLRLSRATQPFLGEPSSIMWAKEWRMVMALSHTGYSPSRVGDFGLTSYRVEHAGGDFQAQILLVA